ncbi:MAG: cytochrome c maturation protein CcmE [Geminicoccaceae bacterium]
MTSRKRQRLYLVLGALLLLGTATSLVLNALGDNVSFFVSPADLAEKSADENQQFRLGGLVVDGSVKRGEDAEVSFRLTDSEAEVQVVYTGLLPDLFREGQGIIAQGRLLPDGSFRAEEVLAKHDENYMPRELADALKDKGVWQEGEETLGAAER